MSSDDDKPVKLTSRTFLSVGLVVSCAGAILSGAMWLNGRLTSIEYGQQTMNNSINDIKVILNDRVTFGSFESWTELLSARNPTLNVPEPRK